MAGQHETAEGGADVILDMVGGDYIPRNLKALAEEHLSYEAFREQSRESLIILLLSGEAVRSRAEGFAPGEGFDTVIARAVAELAELPRLAVPLFGEG